MDRQFWRELWLLLTTPANEILGYRRRIDTLISEVRTNWSKIKVLKNALAGLSEEAEHLRDTAKFLQRKLTYFCERQEMESYQFECQVCLCAIRQSALPELRFHGYRASQCCIECAFKMDNPGALVA